MGKERRVPEQGGQASRKQTESVYSRNELIGAAVAFGVKPEIVAGALELAGKNEMTKAEAKAAIKKLLGRKV